jgi:hypothetical protein
VVAAVIGAGATLLAQQISSTEAPASSTPFTAVMTEPAQDPSQPSPPAETGSSEVLWSNHFNMGNYVNFDVIPPRNSGGNLHQDVTGTYHVYDNAALWESRTPPSKRQCVDRISTHALKSIPADVGTQFCYRTRGDRIVFIKVLEIEPGEGILASPRFETEVTIWRK